MEMSIPCQDRAGAWVSPRPCLIVMDGRGSARLSHLGAAAALCALRTAIRRWEADLAALLDAPHSELAAIGWQGIAQLLYHVAASEQLKLAAWHETQADNFEFTLTIAIVGKASIGWLAVGDSPLVVSRHGIMGLAPSMDEVSFANQTTFVAASPQGRLGLRGSVLPSEGVDAVIAMSDGTATKLVHIKQQIPADAVAKIADGLVSGAWTETLLRDMLKEPGWNSVTRDDRSIALLALRSGAAPKPEFTVNEHLAQATTPNRKSKVALPIKGVSRSKKIVAVVALLGSLMAIWLAMYPPGSIAVGGENHSSTHRNGNHPHPENFRNSRIGLESVRHPGTSKALTSFTDNAIFQP